MEFKISGAFYRMSEPEEMTVKMPQGMESYIILRFYEPMIIVANEKTTVTKENACIILEPRTSRQYCAVKGGFTNDYVSFIAEEAFVKRYDLPLNRVFYVNDPQYLSSHIGFITWALTDVLHDHKKLIQEETETILQYVKENITSLHQEALYPVHENYVSLRDEVKSAPSVWTVEKMAEEMHLSRSHFSMNYKSIFGVSPRDDLGDMVMNKAKKLLAETDEKVSAVAEECGYANTENFIRAFRERFGATPLCFRKNHKVAVHK